MSPRLLLTHDWRLYVAGRRWHHGRTGLLLTAIGLGLVLHDFKDRPWPSVP